MVAVESIFQQIIFFRLFKDVYGVSPYQYIKQKRMLKANDIMKKNRLPLAQLAMEVGYSDIFSFNKAYKQYFGCSPTQSKLF
ncbi:MAG: helix-turn-helix transcriptional regulator [Saprospiraceae bacterium]|nr:helix-turn-helix transcriptional regulator [Saprospiraceae bacterium]